MVYVDVCMNGSKDPCIETVVPSYLYYYNENVECDTSRFCT